MKKIVQKKSAASRTHLDKSKKVSRAGDDHLRAASGGARSSPLKRPPRFGDIKGESTDDRHKDTLLF